MAAKNRGVAPMEQLNFFDQAVDPPRPHEYLLPKGAGISACRSCNAQVVWMQTPAGANIPLALSTVVTRHGQTYAQSHFLDCPHANAWGKKGPTP